MRRGRTWPVVVLGLTLAVASCGGGGGGGGGLLGRERGRDRPDNERRERDRPEDLVVVGEGGSRTDEDPTGRGGDLESLGLDLVTVTDSNETLEVVVSAEWDDLADTGEDTDGDGLTDSGTGIVASTSVDDFFETWGISGVAFTATSNPSSGTMQGDFDGVNAGNSFPDDCVDEGSQDYSDDVYSGRIRFWSACGGDTQWITVAARAVDLSHGVIVNIALAPGDEDFLDPILDSFRAVGPVPG